MHFRFIIHEYSHYQICVSIPRFVGVYIYAGTINRTPTAANGLPITWLTDCNNAMFENENYSFISQKRGFLKKKGAFSEYQNGLFCFSKHYSLNCKTAIDALLNPNWTAYHNSISLCFCYNFVLHFA